MEYVRQTLLVWEMNTNIFVAYLIVESKDTVERVVNGRRLKLTRWVYAPAAYEFHVLADQEGKVYLASGFTGFGGGTAEQNGVFVREGYYDLREKPRENALVSQATFEVSLKAGIKWPLRDGVKLSTVLYIPSAAQQPPLI